MKKHTIIAFPVMFILLLFGCQDPLEEVQPKIESELSCRNGFFQANKLTGFVQIQWQTKGGKDGAQDKKGFALINAQDQLMNKNGHVIRPASGFFVFSVRNDDFELERRIVAKVLDVGFSEDGEKKGWIFAEVVKDSKCDGGTDHSGCGGGDHSDGGCGGDDHTDGGCSGGDDHGGGGSRGSDMGGGSHDDGGCSGDHDTGDETTHDGGCSGEHETTTVDASSDSSHDGGCSHDDGSTTDEGGCSHDDGTTDEGGCSHDDGTTHDDGGCGGESGSSGGSQGGSDKGGKGKECRVGQYVIVKIHDKGSPGTEDGIAWKWYESLDGFVIEDEPKKLCKKTILGGNLAAHQKKNGYITYKGH